MANFLTNLVKRSFGAESAIRPHRASLFEPASSIPGTPNPAADWVFETTSFRDAEAQATMAEPERDRSRLSARPASPRRSLPIEGPPLEAILSLQDESEAGPLTAKPVPPGQVSQPKARTEEQTAALCSSLSQPSRSESIPSASLAPMIGRTDQPPPEWERSALASPGNPLDPRALAEHRSRSSMDAELLSHVTDRSSLMPAQPMTPAAVRGRKRASGTFEHSRTEAEPTIQVTIGRVEVRAEVGGQAPRRIDRTASPVMTLDEYLRRRARRGGE